MKNVLIAGAGRSGTTILGELFHTLPHWDYGFEWDLDNLGSYNEPVAIKNPRSKERTPGLQFNVEQAERRFGPLNYIWIVRHPLDMACSYVPLIRTGDQEFWGLKDDWKSLSYLESLEYALRHWRLVNTEGFDNINPGFVVKYRDLVLHTAQTVGEILDYVGSEWHPALNSYVAKVNNVSGKHESHWQKHWYRDNHTKRVGRYKENIPEEDVGELWGIVSDIAEEFGFNYD